MFVFCSSKLTEAHKLLTSEKIINLASHQQKQIMNEDADPPRIEDVKSDEYRDFGAETENLGDPLTATLVHHHDDGNQEIREPLLFEQYQL